MAERTRATLVFEDQGKKSVTQTMQVEAGDGFDPNVDMSYAVVQAIAARILFKTGLLEKVGTHVVYALALGEDPEEAALQCLRSLLTEEQDADGGDTQ